MLTLTIGSFYLNNAHLLYWPDAGAGAHDTAAIEFVFARGTNTSPVRAMIIQGHERAKPVHSIYVYLASP